MPNSLILMIHGLTGNVTTWGNFPDLLAGDAEIAQRFTIAKPYTYTTSAVGRCPGIDALARELATYLQRSEFAACQKIAILAHSQGGLIAKRLVADLLMTPNAGPLRVDRIMTFASPMLGAGGASVMQLGGSRQVRDLTIGSDFMNNLGRDWANTGADSKVIIKHVVAGDDAIVGLWSATSGFRYATNATIGGVSHKDIVKPSDAKATAFELAKQFLLDTRPAWQQPLDARHFEQPVLDRSTLPNSSAARDNIARFIFRARAVTFFGRDSEWETLTEFLAGADSFLWMVISGAGGAGKSRIALELCLACDDCWYAGFLPEYGRSQHDWQKWQPLAPTLLVFDYATRTPDSIQLLHVLAQRTMPEASFPLTQPVRALLLIRPADEVKLNEDVVSGHAAMPVQLTGAQQFLRLGKLEDPWAIFETVFAQANRPLPDKVATLEAYSHFDPKGRPLFAFLFADAMVSTPPAKLNIRHLDTKRLLTDVIQRWRSHFWQPAFDREGLGKGDAEVTLLALSTLCGGIPIKQDSLPACSIAGLLPTWHPYSHPRVFEAMTGVAFSSDVPTLEPDILGEHFVVEQWARRSASQRQCLLNLAWSISAPGMAAFLLRLWHDLPEDQLGSQVVASLLGKPIPQTSETAYWRGQLGINLLARIRQSGFSAADNLLQEMKALCGEFDQALFRESWAKGANNMLAYLSLVDPMDALELLDQLQEFADIHDEPALREWWAKGAFNVLTHFLRHNPVAAHLLLDKIKAYADMHAETPLRESWARGAYNVVSEVVTRDLDAAQALLEEMDIYAQTFAEASLRESWAKGAVNVLNSLVRHDYQAALMLLEHMRAWAKPGAEAPLRMWWATAVVNVVTALGNRDLDAVQLLQQQVKDYADTCSSEAGLKELWARVVVSMLRGYVTRKPDAAWILLDQLKDYADTYDCEVPLREWWAKSAFNVFADLLTYDPDAARSLLKQMSEYAQTYAEEPLMQCWVSGALKMHDYLASNDPHAALLLHIEIESALNRAAGIASSNASGWALP